MRMSRYMCRVIVRHVLLKNGEPSRLKEVFLFKDKEDAMVFAVAYRSCLRNYIPTEGGSDRRLLIAIEVNEDYADSSNYITVYRMDEDDVVVIMDACKLSEKHK